MSNKKQQSIAKHSAAIHSENKVSLLARKTWNVLFANAYEELYTKNGIRHTITLKELSDMLGLKGRDQRGLKDALKNLVQTPIRWNILDKDKQETWVISTMLAAAKIKKGSGVCEYEYSMFLREALTDPQMFARISLSIQQRFRSKYSLALYELCMDYFDAVRGEGETPWIGLDEYRQLMGIGDRYKEFRELSRNTVSNPVAEINSNSNLCVEYEFRRVRRAVASVKFKIKSKGGEHPKRLPNGAKAKESRKDGHGW